MNLGWRIPFSAEQEHARRAHMLVTTRYEGLAFRACLPGQVVNIALAHKQSVVDYRCLVCERIEAKQRPDVHRQHAAPPPLPVVPQDERDQVVD